MPAYGPRYENEERVLRRARDVFITGNDLQERWSQPGRLTVLDTQFGLGLNFLATWDAFDQSTAADARLHYLAFEDQPLAATDLALMLRRWPTLAARSAQLVAQWPPLIAGLHRLHFENERLTLTLAFGDAGRLLPRVSARVDAFYIDGPQAVPEPAALIPALARLARPGATLVAGTGSAALRRQLEAAGLTPRALADSDSAPLIGRFRGAPPAAATPERRAVVIGAGMAGTCCAHRLAARGWQVTLVERHRGVAEEASGNPTGVLLPLINLSDTPGARLSRACLLYAGRHFGALGASEPGAHWRASGVLQLARDGADLQRHGEIFDRLGFPPDFARPVDAHEASALAGSRVLGSGWIFGHGGWLAPKGLCAAQIHGQDARISTRFLASAAQLARREGEWCVHDAQGQTIAQAPQMVLANAAMAAELAPGLVINSVRGQISLFDARAEHKLALPVCRRGYVTPALGGVHSLGATFDHDLDDPTPRLRDHLANLEKLQHMLPDLAQGLDAACLGARVAFRATTMDRLPLLGPVADTPGLQVIAGLGARGLVWAPLAAEILASALEGDPLPVETALFAALDPQRFARRRRGA